MEITKFGLQNFRIFKEHFDFELAPIMVLTGPNNSGKSSLSKALLLLKENENLINRPDGGSFDYSTGEHNLGDGELVVNDVKEKMVFSFKFFKSYTLFIDLFEDEGMYLGNFKITNANNDVLISKNYNKIFFDVKLSIKFFKERLKEGIISAKSKDSSFLVTDYNSKVNYKKVEELIYYLEEFSAEFDKIEVVFDESSKDYVKYKKEPVDRFYKIIFIALDYDKINIDSSDWLTSCPDCFLLIFEEIIKIKLSRSELDFLIPMIADNYFLFPDLIYMPTIKEPFKRRYLKNEDSLFLKRIEEMWMFDSSLINLITRNNSLKSSPMFADRYGQGKEIPPIDIPEYYTIITKWLDEFGIGELSTIYNYEFETYIPTIDGKSLLEYGLGFGLIVSILIEFVREIKYLQEAELYKTKKRQKSIINFPVTYIIEEPETGLHPAFQSKIAEMLVDLQKTFNVNLIIETHSEYFIRKLQYLTATNEIKPDDAVIYYFNNPKKVPEGEEQIKKITIDKNGSLSDSFGPGFIDEGTNLKFEILRLNRERQN
jgi:AAA15 family ATPase/GTPase